MMKPSKKTVKTLITTLLVIVAAIIKYINGYDDPTEAPPSIVKTEKEQKVNLPNDLECKEGCHLVPNKRNDGDSFIVNHNGIEQEYRIYFVDAPESKDKPYDDHRRRVLEQGQDLGGLSYDETIVIGSDAKTFTRKLLSRPFEIITKGELVYQGPRKYAFVRVEYEGEKRWLHEILLERGLGRLKTRGTTTPDGTSFYDHRDYLKTIVKKAEKNGVGAWAL